MTATMEDYLLTKTHSRQIDSSVTPLSNEDHFYALLVYRVIFILTGLAAAVVLLQTLRSLLKRVWERRVLATGAGHEDGPEDVSDGADAQVQRRQAAANALPMVRFDSEAACVRNESQLSL